MDLKKEEVRLIPFKVEEIKPSADEIPYGVKKMNAPSMWEKGEKGSEIVIAILDTGIDINHPDLKDRIIGGKNFTGEGSHDDFSDGNGHGTHVAGIIGASENQGGIIGVAPQVKLLILKVLDSHGNGGYESIINGIRYATDWRGNEGEKVSIINASLGGPHDSQELHDAIIYATNHDVSVVCASGNEGDSEEGTFEYSYPGAYKEVIQVAACDEDNILASFSNNNRRVDVISYGVNILSTYLNGQYAILSGTSMATPHVSGAMALLIKMGEKHFERPLCEAEAYAMLVKNTIPLGYKASSEGHGLLKFNEEGFFKNLIASIKNNFQ